MISDELVARVERLTGQPAHVFLRRGIFFSHRDLDLALDAYESGAGFYLYTGRGPSMAALHLGHTLPFEFTAYLQRAFKAPLVIQLTDDEKFLKKGLTLEQAREFTRETVRQIIAFGFDVERTFIFSDFGYMGEMYPTVCAIQRHITCSQMRATFGVANADNVGAMSFPAVQMAPAFPSTFPGIVSASERPATEASATAADTVKPPAGGADPEIKAAAADDGESGDDDALARARKARREAKRVAKAKKRAASGAGLGAAAAAGTDSLAAGAGAGAASSAAAAGPLCLIPCGIDQDVYFRLLRDVATKLGEHKPAVVHGKFLPALEGIHTKMSTTVARGGIPPITLVDTKKAVSRKMGRAFSGGKETVEEHRRLGANTDVDVPLHYLRAFMADDAEFARIEREYRAGRMLSGEIKGLAAEASYAVVKRHQEALAHVSDDDIDRFMARRALKGHHDA